MAFFLSLMIYVYVSFLFVSLLWVLKQSLGLSGISYVEEDDFELLISPFQILG